MGKCKFAESWLDVEAFKHWLKRVENNDKEAYCTVCKKTISVVSMGINAVRTHMKGASHRRSISKREQQPSIVSFCALPTAVPTTLATATAAPALPAAAVTDGIRGSGAAAVVSADIRTAVGGTSTLQAEVIWCLYTAVTHHSLNSNEGISNIFKTMFPDSDIAKTFSCGKDKTGYMIRFGLASFFKQQLIDNINKAGPFVLMFDESLNQSTKKKQLDVHIRFWQNDSVQSRYLGSRFLGHGKAEDLLHNIKVSYQLNFIIMWNIFQCCLDL